MAPPAKSEIALKLQPFQLLRSPEAQAYKHIHAPLLLGIFYACFSRVVENPVTWLSYLIVPLAVLQTVFTILCVPSPSASRAKAGAVQQPAQSQQRKQRSSATVRIMSKLSSSILSTLASMVVTTVPITIILVLHGAPVTTHIPETLLLALHISMLSCSSLFYVHGVDPERWRTVYSLTAPVDELMGAAIGTLLGAWLGAIPIPLDWDREWQKWPITVVVGAYGGWAVGRTLGGIPWLKGRVVEFD